MSFRFPSIEAMEAAFGKRFNIKDTFKSGGLPAPIKEDLAGKVGRAKRISAGPTPHDILWEAVRQSIDGAEREFKDAVPGRKFRLDIAIPDARLAIEVDGWEWHGRHKGDFVRDRERQNLLTLHGWRILRFTAGQIRKDADGCVEIIRRACCQ